MSELKEYFENLPLESLIDYKRKCDEKYYNNANDFDDCIADDVYDILEEVISRKTVKKSSPIVGAKTKINRIQLPFYMGSMNKLKTDSEINKWKDKHSMFNFISQEKLDGVSCLAQYDTKGFISLFTRGDGNIGSNISNLVPFLPSLPKLKSSVVVRGELIMSKDVFNRKYASSYSNSRNLVSGIINSTINVKENIIKDIDFVAYEVITNTSISSETQLKLLNQYGFQVVKNQVLHSINLQILSEVLTEMKLKSNYQIDGIIIHSNGLYTRNINGNPEYAFAFKMRSEDNVAEVTVTNIEWNVTKRNILKPKIKIKPTFLCGVTITNLSGFNARYIKDNNIGLGSILLITRSNDVIPYVLKVIKPTNAHLPPSGSYKWNETNIDIIADVNVYKSMSEIKIISYFFKTLNIKHLNDATVYKLFSAGFNTLEKIFRAKISEFEKIDGFGKKLAERTYNNIKDGLKDVPLYLLIAGSCTLGFGLGVKKVKKIFDDIPYILEDKTTLLYDELMKIEGLSQKTAIQILDNLESAREFYKKVEPFVTMQPLETKVLQKNLSTYKVCFSGIRDLELVKQIESQGGKVLTSISKNITYLVVKNESDSSSKIERAREYGVKVINITDFISLLTMKEKVL